MQPVLRLQPSQADERIAHLQFFLSSHWWGLYTNRHWSRSIYRKVYIDAVLLTHYARPLAGLLLHGKCELPPEPVAFRWRFGPLAMTLLIVWSLFIRVYQGIVLRRPFYGAGHPIYGLYDVVEFKGGATRPAWKRVAGDGRYDSGAISVQLANGEVERYVLKDDSAQRTWTLRRGRDSAAEFRYTVDPDGSASLDGRIGSDPVHMRLHRVDPEKFFPLARK